MDDGRSTIQINHCRGEQVSVALRNGDVVDGVLSFFNYDEQVIHLQHYELIKPDGEGNTHGKFIVINKNSWHTLTVYDEVYKND